MGRGRGGVGWGRKGRAGPTRPRPRALARALPWARSRLRAPLWPGAVVSVAVAPRSGSPPYTLAAASRALRAGAPVAVPPPRSAPRRSCPALPPRLRALIETGGWRPDSPALPAPPGPRPPPPRRPPSAGRCASPLPAPPAVFAPAASRSRAAPGRLLLLEAGRASPWLLPPPPPFPRQAEAPGAAGVAALGHPPWAAAEVTLRPTRRPLCLWSAVVLQGVADKHTGRQAAAGCLAIHFPTLRPQPLRGIPPLRAAEALLQATLLGARVSRRLPHSLPLMPVEPRVITDLSKVICWCLADLQASRRPRVTEETPTQCGESVITEFPTSYCSGSHVWLMSA